MTLDGRGRLSYATEQGARIPDFGGVGYRGGFGGIPAVRTVARVSPIAGDNTAHLQAAIDTLGGRPPGVDGWRGALELEPGTYEVAGTVRAPFSNMVIRGAGDGPDPARNSVLRAVGNAPQGRDVLVVGGVARLRGPAGAPRVDITSEVVHLGSRRLSIRSGGAVQPGDRVVIVHPCTREWLASVNGGATGSDAPWRIGQVPLVYVREVTDLTGGEIVLDAPLYANLDRSLARSYLQVWDHEEVATNIGIESLRIDIAADRPEEERHAANGIRLCNVRDAWVQGCSVLHFVKAGILTIGATRTTIMGCQALDPVSRVTGGRRYCFDAEEGSQQILFTDCHARGGRHSFVVNGAGTASGIVFHRTTATGSLASSEGHRRWSQGLLFDNHRELEPLTNRTILLGTRGDYGTGHGWSAVNSVAWNTDPGGARLIVQDPPGDAQNFAIGCRGDVSGSGPFSAKAGYVEGTGRPGLQPSSLYEAQRSVSHSSAAAQDAGSVPGIR